MVEGNRARYKSVERIGVGGAGEGDSVAPRRNSLANQSAAGAWTGTERHRAAREKVGGGTGNRQDNLERERERRRSGRRRVEGCTLGGEEGDSHEWG